MEAGNVKQAAYNKNEKSKDVRSTNIQAAKSNQIFYHSRC